MKKLIYLIFFFLPVIVCAQFNLYNDSPLDYAWKYVGTSGFSTGLTNYISLAFSPSGQPYVAYQDGGNSNKATVMMFDGVSWVNVGNAGFSSGTAGQPSFDFSPSGQPYVAYMDGGNYNKGTVMKYDSVFVGINEQQESRLSLYPNPATDKITIESAKFGNLSIMNLTGQKLISQQVSELKTVIDISSLPSGVYFVRLTNDKIVEGGKIIKE